MATVTLDRPERRNAQTPAMWRALAGVPARLPAKVRVVVLRAEGPSFSAGLDRAVLEGRATDGGESLLDVAALPPAELDAAIAGFQRAFTWWQDGPAVTVAAVGGHAVGAGFQLALACDLRVCADDAHFAMRETSLGLVPDLAGTAPLVAAVGYSRALEICATGRWVRAEEARELGLATAVVPRAELDAATADLVAALLAAPAGALLATKALLRGAATRTAEQQRAHERATQAGRLAELLAAGRG
ncbi:MAG TPA: enoyl-CoA hydratase/isomerase family protein [Jiangellales bacterium]|nr:enoyl-CoA hydratase/isomerase family protein [Jiangellales bacterium]